MKDRELPNSDLNVKFNLLRADYLHKVTLTWLEITEKLAAIPGMSLLEPYSTFVHDIHNGYALFVLQGDNCGPYRARCIAICLKNEKVTHINRLEQSMDLNPIGNAWNIMKLKLSM